MTTPEEARWPTSDIWGAMPSIEAAEHGEDSYHLHRWLLVRPDGGPYEQVFFFHAEKVEVEAAALYLNGLEAHLAEAQESREAAEAERDDLHYNLTALDALVSDAARGVEIPHHSRPTVAVVEALYSRVQSAERKLATVRETLERHGRHLWPCPVELHYSTHPEERYGPEPNCDCGLRAALEATAEDSYDS